MKVIITGHTSGVGKSLYDKLIELGHEVWGLSRSNAYDLSTDQLGRFVSAIKNNDIFINNAYHKWAQVDLLYKVYEEWKDTDKMIINISSVTGDMSKKYLHEYQVHKIALDNACKQLQPLGKCKVVNVRPGWIDTNFIRNVKSTIPKDIEILTPNQVADTVIYIINQPKNVCIKSISIEPWYKDE